LRFNTPFEHVRRNRAPNKDGQEILNSAKSAPLHWGIPTEQMLDESQRKSIARVIVSQASRWNAELILMADAWSSRHQPNSLGKRYGRGRWHREGAGTSCVPPWRLALAVYQPIHPILGPFDKCIKQRNQSSAFSWTSLDPATDNSWVY
jgi:hypothetical protein